MTDDKIKQIIMETANNAATATVLKLKAAGLLRDNNKTAYEKTEALLRQYPDLCKVQEPYAVKVVAEIDACLADVSNEPYADVIRLYYFAGMTNEACADTMICDERTCRRNRKKLVEQFSARLASDDFIRELLM